MTVGDPPHRPRVLYCHSDTSTSINGVNESQGNPNYSQEAFPIGALSTAGPALDLLRSRIRAPAVGSRRLAALPTPRPLPLLTRVPFVTSPAVVTARYFSVL
jgi:hypothetical protein